MSLSLLALRVSVPDATLPFATVLLGFMFGFVPGAVPFGYFMGRARGVDLRGLGSGNIGFTNVIRVLGWQYGVPVLVLDVAKGFVPVLLVPFLMRVLAENPYELLKLKNLFGTHFALLQVIAGLGAILGHSFTPVLRFRGGKSVATAAGVVLALSPWTFLVCLGVFLLILLTTRYLSLASMIAALVFPAATLLFRLRGHDSASCPHQKWSIFAFALATAVLITLRHRSNIRRLLSGTENRFTWRSANPQSGDTIPNQRTDSGHVPLSGPHQAGDTIPNQRTDSGHVPRN